MNCWKNKMKFGMKSAMLLKKNLTVSLKILLKEKSIQIFMEIKYQKQVLNVLSNIDSDFRTSKNYYPKLYLEKCKYVIKEKRCINILLATYKFFLMRKILMNNKILIKKNLMSKIIAKNKCRFKKVSLRLQNIGYFSLK